MSLKFCVKKNLLIVLWFILFTKLSQTADAAKILGLFTTPSLSHHIVYKALMKALANRGHEVTYLSLFPPESTNLTGYRQIQVSSKEDEVKIDMIRTLLMQKADIQENQVIGFYTRTIAIANAANNTLNHPAFQQLMQQESFDLIVFGWFMNDFMLGVAGHFKCPIVVHSTIPSFKNIRDFVGNPTESTHAPTMLFGPINPSVLVGRLKNHAAHAIENFLFNVLDHFYQAPLYRYNFPAEKYPSFEDVKKNVSLVLVNYHFSQGTVQSLVPGMVEVGGLHINTDPRPLPTDIKEWLDDAPNGVIYFSLGSNLRSSEMSATKRDAILHGFSSVKEKVLMKWESDHLPNKPTNIMIRKWLPQEDILNHPNVRLFVSHCGASSINEAIYYGVPILGLPIFADQFANLEALEYDNMAIGLSFSQITNETFTKILHQILENPKYLDKARSLSKIYRDRPLQPMDTAIYWIEYVLRHNGAKHLQSPAAHFGFLEYYSLDIFVFLLASLTTFYVVLRILQFITRFIVTGVCKIKTD